MKGRTANQMRVFHSLLGVICCLAMINPAVAKEHPSKTERSEVGVHNMLLHCETGSANGRTTNVMISNNGADPSVVIFEYRQPAGKEGRTYPQSGLRYELAPQQSLNLGCSDLLTQTNQRSSSLSLSVSALPPEGVSVTAMYGSTGSDNTCATQVLPIDQLAKTPRPAAGPFCSNCAEESLGICCATVCCEGDCTDGVCKPNKLTTVDDDD